MVAVMREETTAVAAAAKSNLTEERNKTCFEIAPGIFLVLLTSHVPICTLPMVSLSALPSPLAE